MTMSVELLTTGEIGDIEFFHTRNRRGNCTMDRFPWPCPTLLAALEVERIRADQRKSRQAFAVLVGVDAVPHGLLPAVLALLPEMSDDDQADALERARIAMLKRRGESA